IEILVGDCIFGELAELATTYSKINVGIKPINIGMGKGTTHRDPVAMPQSCNLVAHVRFGFAKASDIQLDGWVFFGCDIKAAQHRNEVAILTDHAVVTESDIEGVARLVRNVGEACFAGCIENNLDLLRRNLILPLQAILLFLADHQDAIRS